MDIIPLNKDTFPSITLNYDLDNTVTIAKDVFENEQNLQIYLYDFLKDARDESSNKYSNFYLTNRFTLKDKLSIRELQNPEVEVFTTWLASDADKTIGTKTNFWITEDVDSNVTTTEVMASGTFLEPDNRYIFDIYLLDDQLCRVGHTYGKYTRYLTINYLNATGSYFCLDNGQDPFDPNSTQTFFYLYDRKNDFIVFYKTVNDIAYILQTDESTKELTLFRPATSDDFGFTEDQIYRCRTRFESLTNPKIETNWVVYQKNFKKNNLSIDDKPVPENNLSPSFINTSNNFLLNTEYYRLSNNTLPINILTLKNTYTPENYNSRNNPFCVREDEILMRQYRKLFTGSNQVGGRDNIKASFEAYTSQRIFEPDKLTYFHAPQDIFPYAQLNIKDTGLIESGAIAGNHPLKADKIFKKQADYKFNSNFGDTKDEQSGTFLCTWLSGSENFGLRPVWIDRYYFPQRTSFLNALTGQAYFYINYKSKDDCILEELPNLNQVIVDIPSRFVFEPGLLYAYHHVGKNTVNMLLSSLKNYLFEKNLSLYKDTTYNSLCGTSIDKEGLEFNFDGTKYGKTNKASFPEIFNQFTVSFYLNTDWKSNFGHAIFGNYVNDGFTVNNTNYITPFLYFKSPSALEVYNTNLEFVDKKTFNYDVRDIVRYDELEDYFAILSNNESVRCNVNNISLDKVTFPNIGSVRSIYPFDNNYVLVLTGGLQNDWYLVNTDTNQLSSATAVDLSPFYVNFTSTGFTNIAKHKNSVYLIQGQSSRVVDNKIYFKGTVGIYNNILFSYDTLTKDRTSAYKFSNLIDLNIGFDKNVYVLHDNNYITKIDQNRNIIYTKEYELSGYTFNHIDLLSYFEQDQYKQELLILSRNAQNNVRLDKIDYEGNIKQTKLLPSTLSASFFDTTGGDYARYFTKEQYPQHNINAKIKLRNVYDYTDVNRIELKYNLSSLDVGYHHFAFRVDTLKGIFSMYLDGVNVATEYFRQNDFIFNNLLKDPFVVGSTPFFNNQLFFEAAKQMNSFLINNTDIKNIYVYDLPLDYCDIGLHNKQGIDFEKIIFDIPSGRRTFLDEIEYVFKNKIPGYKTGVFDLEIKNSGITDNTLKLILEKQIIQTLDGILPTYTKLRSIIWRDYNPEISTETTSATATTNENLTSFEISTVEI
jgi:hypothetical protein